MQARRLGGEGRSTTRASRRRAHHRAGPDLPPDQREADPVPGAGDAGLGHEREAGHPAHVAIDVGDHAPAATGGGGSGSNSRPRTWRSRGRKCSGRPSPGQCNSPWYTTRRHSRRGGLPCGMVFRPLAPRAANREDAAQLQRGGPAATAPAASSAREQRAGRFGGRHLKTTNGAASVARAVSMPSAARARAGGGRHVQARRDRHASAPGPASDRPPRRSCGRSRGRGAGHRAREDPERAFASPSTAGTV